MDLREKKTKRSIYNAFLELRSRKSLEKITIKELAELAEISKATFYLHYKDIYDLSEQLQQELLLKIISFVSEPELFIKDPAAAYDAIQKGFVSYASLINILFSDSQETILPVLIEKELKAAIFTAYPEYREDPAINTQLSFLIMGSFYAYLHNSREFSQEHIVFTIVNMLKQHKL